MKPAEAARALAARRKSHGPKADRCWLCLECNGEMGATTARGHFCAPKRAKGEPTFACLRCGDAMTRSQTRTHKCEAVDRRAKLVKA